jgi:hypothetical protein
MLPAGSTPICKHPSKDRDLAKLTRDDFDSHDWAARASHALTQAKRLPPGSMRLEAIRKAEQLRVAADMKNFLMLKDPNAS